MEGKLERSMFRIHSAVENLAIVMMAKNLI
jgi:hypothetical protein